MTRMSEALTVSNRDLILAGPIGSLESYIQAANSVPMLSAEEEKALARQFRDAEDLVAARQLVLSQLRFVVHIARGYLGYGLPLGDLIQEGNVGLMKAVKRFDPEMNVRLVSFAVHWIRAEIHEFVLKNWRQVKIATTKAQRKLFFNLRKAKKNLGWLSAAETEAVAKDLGVSAREVNEMEMRLAGHDMSFDPDPGANDEEAYAPAHYLPSPDSDPATEVEADDWQADSIRQLTAALEELDPRSREILQARWLSDKKETLHSLADRFGISAERIRQLEQQAMKKMRGQLAA
jgi:RNA polymerase sigma-32 factor